MTPPASPGLSAASGKPRAIDPTRLARISRLELVAKQAVEGFLSGLHPSPYYGSSVEYADYRPYTMGDEIRNIDWKLLAKTDKYYIKLFEEQTNTRSMVMLDVSNSMAFGGEPPKRKFWQRKKKPTIDPQTATAEASGVSPDEPDQTKPSTTATKLDYGCQLAAALAYLAVRQNDAAGLALFDHQVRSYLPPRSTAAHFRAIIDGLEAVHAGNDTGIAAVLHELAGRTKQRSLVMLVSDLLDDPDAMLDGLAHFRHKKHEVIVFHVIDPVEMSFPFDRVARFKDMEGADALVANPAVVRKAYLQRMQAFLDQVRRGCLERQISYVMAQTDTPFDELLRMYLARRRRAGV